MLKQKTAEIQTEQLCELAPAISVGEDNPVFANLASTLTEIRKLNGVTGYILRNSNTAVIDVTPKEALIEYAILSSQIHQSSLAISKEFNLADVESVLLEGTIVKVLCMNIGENNLSVFMDKTCLHASIVKRILL